MLIDLKVQFFEKFILPFDEFLFAYAEENGDLRSEPPKLFILNNSCPLRIILLPETQTIFELEDVN